MPRRQAGVTFHERMRAPCAASRSAISPSACNLGKTMLDLEQRPGFLEKVFELADRFLRAGQDEQNHALLLKAIHAVKLAEEHATAASL